MSDCKDSSWSDYEDRTAHEYDKSLEDSVTGYESFKIAANQMIDARTKRDFREASLNYANKRYSENNAVRIAAAQKLADAALSYYSRFESEILK